MSPKFYQTEIYTNHRDKLCQLLDRGAELLEPKQNPVSWKAIAGQFREKHRKLKENQFTIALLAEMQTGKSTLFNTVACGGREFSPVGSLVRTSGCPVIAQNLADPKAPERAEIDWRTDAELVAGFDRLLLRHFQKLAPERFGERETPAGEKNAPGLTDGLKLSEAADRNLLRQAAELEREQWRRNPAAYEIADTASGKKTGNGDLDVLRFALLVAEFYTHPKLQALRKRRDFKPGEAGAYVRYPSDWQSRWTSGEPNKFDWNEVVFIFVRRANYYLHSPRLAKIGCTLVDCPGLFASEYDEAVAMETMKDADAILYMVSGDKQISASALEVLNKIRTMEHKLFYAWNIKGTSEKDAERLLLNMKDTLANGGFKATPKDFLLIHAALALRGDQAHALLDGSLDDYTRQAIADRREESLDKVPNRIWKDIARFRRDLEDDQDLPVGKDRATADKARELGRVSNFLGKAEDFVVGKGAISVLVRNGSEAVAASLSEVETDLEKTEALATSTLAEHKAKAKGAEKALAEFESRSARTLERLDESGPDDQLADDFLARLDAGLRRQIACDIATTLDNETLGFWAMGGHVWDKIKNGVGAFFNWWPNDETDLERAVKKVCSEKVASAIQGRFTKWQEEIENGQNAVFNRELGGRVKKVNDELAEDWKRSLPPGLPLLDGLKPRRVSENLKEAFEMAQNSSDLAADVARGQVVRLGTNLGMAAGGIIKAILALVAGTTAHTVLGITIFTTTAPWMWPVVIAAAAAAIFGLGNFAKNLVNRREKLQEGIDAGLATRWSELKEGIRPKIRTISAAIRQFYRSEFHKQSLGFIRAKLTEKKAEADLAFQGSQALRDAMAAKSKRLREGQIEPLRRELEEFSKECRKALGVS